MKNAIEKIESLEDVVFGNGVSGQSIADAEQRLNLTFAEDYRAYLKCYGLIAYDGHELTGLGNSDRTNVVLVTKTERLLRCGISQDMYVLEQMHIDDIVIWQSSSGIIWQTVGRQEPVRLASSLLDYLEL